MSGLRCPFCDSLKTTVRDSRPTTRSIRRRRLCESCGERFRTQEIVVLEGGVIVRPGAGGGSLEIEDLKPWVKRYMDRTFRGMFGHDPA